MPAACRKGDSLTTGHIRDSTTTLTTPAQSTVYINGILAARKTDSTVAHGFPPEPPCNPHVASVNAGSSTVFIVGKEAARIGDSADFGAMTSGSSDVYIGG